MENWIQNFYRSHAMMSIDESLWALVTGPHLHRHWSFHSAMSPRRASTKPGPGMVPLSSTRACAETTETTALSSLTNETSPCLLLAAPQHHQLQPFRTNTVQCSLGEGEFEQVQKVHKQLARDLYKILHQNTATGGRRGREIKKQILLHLRYLMQKEKRLTGCGFYYISVLIPCWQ